MHYTKLVLLDGQKKDKRQKDKQQSTKHYTENYRWSNNLKTGLTSDVPWMVSSSCSTSGTGRVTLATNPVICHERGMERIVITTKRNISLVICDRYALNYSKTLPFFSGSLWLSWSHHFESVTVDMVNCIELRSKSTLLF